MTQSVERPSSIFKPTNSTDYPSGRGGKAWKKSSAASVLHRRRDDDADARVGASEIAGPAIKVLRRRANSSPVTNYGVEGL